MGAAIGQALAPAIAMMASPTGVVVAVLVLATPRGRVNGPLFAVGWFVSVAIVTAVLALLVSGLGSSDGGDTPTWLALVLLALGAVLLVLAARSWRGRPRRGDPPRPLPAWMRALDGMTPAKALRTGVLLGGLNPKNILLLMAGEAAIAQTGISTGHQVVALAVLVVVGSLGVLLPVLVYLALGSRSRSLLERFKNWMVANTGAIMAIVLLVIGVMLIADGISALGS